jgi:adenylate kinase family enzyme
MPSDIILIGPVRTGKTTISQLLAERLGLPQIALDDFAGNTIKRSVTIKPWPSGYDKPADS